MQLKDVLASRYATKSFDPDRKLAPELVEQLLDALRFSPSSTNMQPWHFIVASTDEGKARIAAAASGSYAYNEPKVLNASHVVLFCARTGIDDAHLQRVLEAEEAAGRFATDKARDASHNTRTMYLHYHQQKRDVKQWLASQVYLNLGGLLLSAGLLGVDALAMEGLDLDVLEREFALASQGLAAIAVVALGYRSTEDFNSGLPKARLAAGQLFTFI